MTTPGCAKAGSAAAGWASCPTASGSGFCPSATAGCTSTPLDVSSEAARPAQLTSGTWEVSSAEMARDGKKFYLTTSEVHPGERHLYPLPIDGGARTQLTSMTGSNEAEVSPDESTLGLVFSYSNKPPEVLRRGEPARRGGDAGDDDADRGVAGVQVDRPESDHVQGARRRRRLRAAVHAGDDRRAPRSDAPGRGVRARRRLSAERAPLLVDLLPRVHVPQPAGGARLRRARRGLPRQLRLRPRLAHGDLPSHGRARISRTSSTARSI